MTSAPIRFCCAAALASGVAIHPGADALAAPAYEVVRQEASCGTPRDPRSLRQTLIVIDESVVSEQHENNQRWTKIVVEASDAREVSTGTLGARERLSILVARRDGTELVPLLVGCSPNISAAEFDRMKAQDSTLDRFLGRDAEARRKMARDDFASALARALTQVQRRAAEIASQPLRPGSLVRALQNAGHLVDLNQGIPRFILVTSFSVDAAQAPDVPAARQAGFQIAERSGVDFGRAEVYIAGASLTDAALELARAFVLGAKGSLVAVRSDGVPRLLPEPTSVRVYAGFVDYVGQRVPVQLRFAVTAQGDLVNSWIETTLLRTTATPINGKALCRPDGACEVRGDGRFAQVWFPDPHNEPADRTKMPFGGARNFEMMVDNAGAKGRVWDPKVVFVGEDQQHATLKSEELRFEIERKEGLQF
jgi:hypothetical protein